MTEGDLLGSLVVTPAYFDTNYWFNFEGMLVVFYLGASPTAAGPQTGMGLPNGLRRRKFRSSEIPGFWIFDNIAETRFF